MRQEDFARSVADRLGLDPRLHALFLGGSLGRGTSDAWSDVDLLALPRDGDAAGLAEDWPAILGELAEVVFMRRIGQAPRILTIATTADMLRCDLYVTTREDVERRARSGLRPLIDHDDLWSGLRPETAPREPVPARVSYQIEEFLRVLGLVPVVLGRGELITAVQGHGLLRDLLIGLMREESGMDDDGGALHLSKVLPASDLAVLMSLQTPGPDPAEIVAADVELAQHFLPRARRLADRLGLDWPERFEAAVRHHLETELNVTGWPESAARV